ncbi:MAG: hypothetical protein IJ217_04760 [Clostridia bacterium]|nr:hypothetical protein [Clostridia bacterium]
MLFDAAIVALFVLFLLCLFRGKHSKKGSLKVIAALMLLTLLGSFVVVYNSVPRTEELLVHPSKVSYLEELNPGSYAEVNVWPEGDVWYRLSFDDADSLVRASRDVRLLSMEATPYKAPALLKCCTPATLLRSQLLLSLWKKCTFVLILPQDSVVKLTW